MIQNNPNDGGVIGVFILLAGFLIFMIVLKARQSQARTRALREGLRNYLDSLEELKHSPTNANLRQRTLELGRHYSNLTRNKQGVTVFDEVALSNDIGAACAGAGSVMSDSVNSTPLKNIVASSGSSIEERLTKLSELKARGLIDEQEYESKRARILDEV
jgi:cytochrome c-type biogenesis protein CcmH/NrfG